MKTKTFQQSCELMNHIYHLHHEDMTNLMLDNAVDYLNWYVNGDTNAVVLWLETPEFWSWWLQIWLKKDETMLSEHRHFENPWRTYQVLHRSDFIHHMHPNSAVYEAVVKRAKAKRLNNLQIHPQHNTEVLHA